MKQYQYAGGDYTMVRLEDGGEKIKVVDGEIVESDREENYFTKNNFVLLGETEAEEGKTTAEEITEEVPEVVEEAIEVVAVDDGKPEITIEVEEKKKSKK